jgi:hypothetical protein
MQNEQVIPLPTDFKVMINYSYARQEIEDAVLRRVDMLWKQEIIRTEGKVFNGTILNAEKFDGSLLLGHFVEYKHYIAQTRDPSLASIFNIQPICVSAYTHAGDQILFGKRSNHVTDYQNFYELVPAGGVDKSSVEHDRIDILKQIKTELKEEAGIDESKILNITPAYLIPYAATKTYEICAKIELDPQVKDFLGERDDEYTALHWISKDDLPSFVEKNRAAINPLSLQLLKLFN